jgi:hypothetical protein
VDASAGSQAGLARQGLTEVLAPCRYLERPRTPASQKHWWDWQPQNALQGGVLGNQEVCTDGAYIDKFIVSIGSAAVNANSTRAYRMKGMLSIQGRCSNGKQLGYYGPQANDASVIYSQENIQVLHPAHGMAVTPC